MAIEEYGVLAASVGLAVIVGFVLGKLSANASSNRSTTQRISLNEINRWKINSKYSDILTEKTPEKVAESEMSKLVKMQAKNEQISDDIESRLDEYLVKLEKIRKDANNQNSPAGKAAKREIALGLMSSTVDGLRQDVEDCNAVRVSHTYTKRFLNFIIHGNRKPGLVELMDNHVVKINNENSHKMNLESIESQMQSMTSENEEEIDGWFGINR